MADSQRKSAQLFDKDNVNSVNAYFNSNNPSLITSDSAKCIYIQCEPNTTYTVNKAVSSRFFVGSCETEPQVGTVVNNIVGGNDWFSYLTVTTGDNDHYLVAFVYRTQDTMTFAELCDTIMINTGSTAKSYEPYGWLHSLRKLATATEAVENPLYSDGTAITAYNIKGNEEHTGTPTPSNPVEVNGVGERTENLFDEVYPNISGTVQYIPLNVGEGTFTLSSDAPLNRSNGRDLFFLAGNVSSGANSGQNGVSSNQTKTQTAVDGYVTIGYRKLDGDSPDVRNYHTMLNSGSTAKPYEPYGYKIPISSGQQTTNIYLGSTQTVRQIKKLVFDGTQSVYNCVATTDSQNYCCVFRFSDIGMTDILDFNAYMTNIDYPVFISDRFVQKSDTKNTYYNDISDGEMGANDTNGMNRYVIFCVSGFTTAEEYIEWFKNNPTELYYILGNPETAAVNEPLMKIGDYADTLSNATAIPTTEGANSITVDTTVQPSEFTATWTGWHDSSVKEWDGSQWG